MLRANEDRASGIVTSARWTQIYDDLKAAILAHAIAPVPNSPKTNWARSIRSAVRWCGRRCRRWRMTGWCNWNPIRGAFVAKPSKREAREVFEARAIIEPRVAVMTAAVAKKPADVKLLRKHLDEEHKAIHDGRQGDAIMLSARFRRRHRRDCRSVDTHRVPCAPPVLAVGAYHLALSRSAPTRFARATPTMRAGGRHRSQ